jgi:dipeptidyl aminopeptidase/acylaminoacyl peptidase
MPVPHTASPDLRKERNMRISFSTATLAFLFSGLLVSPAYAQRAGAAAVGSIANYEPPAARATPFDLTIRNIMRGEELVGRTPTNLVWSDDNRWLYFRWLPGGSAWHDEVALWRVAAAGGQPERLSNAAADSLGPILAGGELSRDRRWRVAASQGDLFLVDRSSLAVRRLTRTREAESAPRFSSDGSQVFYREGDNLFALTLATGSVRQLTDVRPGPRPAADQEPEGQRGFLARQQRELFEHIRLDRARADTARVRREAREAAEPKPLYLDRNERIDGLTPNEQATHVLIGASVPAGTAERTVIIPDWVTGTGFTEEIRSRTKVGDVLTRGRVGLLNAATGETTWLKLAPAGSDSTIVAGSVVGWNDVGTHALLTARSDDDQNLWLYSLNAATGALTLLDHVSDSAWVAGPCGGCRGWIPGTNRAYYVTEATGWAHLYTIDADGTNRRQLTSGEWEVQSLLIPESRDHFLLTTSEGSPFDRHAVRMAFDGSAKRALSSGRGSYLPTPSPDGRTLAFVHSRANQPPEVYLADAASPERLRRVTVSPTADWTSFGWREPEIVHIPAEDGTRVPARIYRPSEMGAEPNGAGVIFVHGAGYAQNVHNYWSTYFREYMFHHFLAANGYTVLDIDYRGSAGYGRDWRTAIYRWMGGKDLSDQVDGARWLIANERVAADRIGIYGGSYGGFITLMALFTSGSTFKSGAALRSVTDWAHYNDNYTSNILNDPQEDTLAYKRSSPIYFAENLRPDQHLLMLHGMVDTNVHFSDIVRLSQRLIELGKENWELAVYPVEDHSFVEPSSWTDEYRRIFELFERTLSRPGCGAEGTLCPVPRATLGGGGTR